MGKINYAMLPLIGKYRELYAAYPDSMRQHMDDDYPDKEIIVNYMKSALAYAAKAQYLHDCYTDEPIPMESLEMTDGNYRWPSELLYYVEKYNLHLPDEFVQVALKNKVVSINISTDTNK